MTPVYVWGYSEASVETERNRVSFVINRRLGGPARDLSSVRVYQTRPRRACAGVSGCRRYALLQGSISIVVVDSHYGEQSGCSMEGEIDAKEQAENRRGWRD